MEFQELLEERRTVRRFKQFELNTGDMRYILEAARQASCASNNQQLRYIAVMSEELVKKIFPLTRYAGKVTPRRNPVPGISAPTAFIAVTVPENAGAHIMADAGAAIQSMQFAAWERGIGCCWLGSFDKKAAEALLSPLNGRSVLYLVALGFIDESPVSEDIDSEEKVSYYLDKHDTLHVPKLTVDVLTQWR